MQTPLRIIQVVNVRWFNATAWYALFLSRLLKDEGHEVRVIGLEGTESFKKAQEMGLNPIGMDLNTSNPLRLAAAAAKAFSLAREFRPHIINCHRGEGMMLWGMLRAAGLRFGLVRTRGDQRPPKANVFNKFLYNTAADAVIATNSATIRSLRSLLHTPEHRIFLVPGGVDTKVFRRSEEGRAKVRKEFGFGPEELAVGILGRFDHVKGQKELIEALAALRSGGPEEWRGRVRLLLMGFPTDAVSREDVVAWLQANKMADVAYITGRRDDVADMLSSLDLGVIASQGSEAVARAAFEMMSCGVPLVGTDVGVMPDLLPETSLAPAGSPKALEHLLAEALGSTARREALREESLRRISDLSEGDFVRQTLKVYAKALAAVRLV